MFAVLRLPWFSNSKFKIPPAMSLQSEWRGLVVPTVNKTGGKNSKFERLRAIVHCSLYIFHMFIRVSSSIVHCTLSIVHCFSPRRAIALFLSILMISPGAFAQGSNTPKNNKTTETASAETSAENNEYPPLLIGPGDHLTIMVLGYEHNVSANTDFSSGGKSGSNSNLPSEYMVDSDGRILFPFVGVIKLSGLSPIEAGNLLMKKLTPYMKYPQVTVLITQTNTYCIAVLGDVFKPGQYMILGKPNLVSMMALAGGPMPEADLGGVLITRGTEKIKADLGKLLNDKNYHGTGPTVYPGDIIYVPKNGWPSMGDWAIVASILASAAVITIELK